MNKTLLAQMISQRYAGLSGLTPNFKQAVGDAFNLETLARLLVEAETQDDTSPQMMEATEYAKFIPVKLGFAAVVGTSHELKRMYGVGEGQPYSGQGDDIPLAEAVYDDVKLPTKPGVIGYEYNIMELATASAMGISLATDKIKAARLAFEKHMSKVAWYGEPATGVKGFLNQDGVSVVAALQAWELDTPDEILQDVNDIISNAIDDTEFNAAITPDTIVLPTSLMKILTSRRLTDNTETTIYQHIIKNNMLALEGKSVTFRSTKRLETAGVGGTRRIIVYCRDPSCIEMRIPQDLQFLAGQPKGLEIFFPGHYLYQGVWLKRVDSMRYLDVPLNA